MQNAVDKTIFPAATSFEPKTATKIYLFIKNCADWMFS